MEVNQLLSCFGSQSVALQSETHGTAELMRSLSLQQKQRFKLFFMRLCTDSCGQMCHVFKLFHDILHMFTWTQMYWLAFGGQIVKSSLWLHNCVGLNVISQEHLEVRLGLKNKQIRFWTKVKVTVAITQAFTFQKIWHAQPRGRFTAQTQQQILCLFVFFSFFELAVTSPLSWSSTQEHLSAQPHPEFQIHQRWHNHPGPHHKQRQDGQQTSLMSWCKWNNLSLNVSKTKEMIVVYRRQKGGGHPPNAEGTQHHQGAQPSSMQTVHSVSIWPKVQEQGCTQQQT